MPRTRRTPVDQGFQTSGQDWSQSSGANDVSFGGQHYQEFSLNFDIHVGGTLDDAYVSTVVLWDTGLLSLGPATAAQIAFVDSGADPWTGNGGAGFPGQFIAFDYTPGVRHDYYHYAIGQVDYVDDWPDDPNFGFEYWDAVATAFFDFDGGQLIIDESGFSIVDDYTNYGGYRLGNDSTNTYGANNEAYWDWSSWLAFEGSIDAEAIVGTEFSDRLTGHEGADTLTGGAGRDVFEYWTPADSSIATGMDRITDFQTGQDIVDVQYLEISAIWVQWIGGVYRLNIQTTPGTLVIESVLPISANDVRGDNWLHQGTPFADQLDGRPGVNVFDGGGGGDTMDGGAGASEFRYDAVTDSSTATGIDRIAHFGSDDRIVVNGLTGSSLSVSWAYYVQPVHLVLSTADGDLVIDLADATAFSPENFRNQVLVNLAVTGTAGADRLEGAGLADALDGKGGADTLEGYAGDDTLDGGGGDDQIRGHGGNDLLYGGTGHDSIDGGPGSNTISGGSGNDTLAASGSSGGNDVHGDYGNDYMDVTVGSNTIDGGAGDDTIRAGADESVTGGDGIDTVILDPYLRVNLADGLIRSYYGNSVVGTITGVENLEGLDGSYELVGDALDNRLTGNTGNDTLDGGGGANTLTGGNGSDLYHVRSSSDVIIELPDGGSADAVYSYIASFALPAEIEDARIRTGGAANLTGNGKDNLLYAGTGNNIIDGGGGIDTVFYTEGVTGATGVSVRLDTAAAQATGGSGTDTLLNVENLVGSGYDDALTGDASANRLDGAEGNDTLVGAAGDDTLQGGAGDNSIDGGWGANAIFAGVGDVGNNTIVAANGANTISVYSFGSTSITLGSGDNTIDLYGGGTALIRTGNGDNRITAWHSGLNDIRTGKGEDTIEASGRVHAKALHDVVNGLGGNDTLYGDGGNDTISGGAGSDLLYGGGGNDVLSDFHGNNLLYGGPGTDILQVDLQDTGYHALVLANDTDGSVFFTTAAGTTRAYSTEGARLGGTPQADTLTGAAWDDTIDGAGGADVIDGAGGVDTVVLPFDADSYAYAVLGDGQPVNTTGGPVSLSNIESMQTTGTPNDDLFVGGSGNDDIRSAGGDDVIQGLGGDDVLGAVLGDLRGGDGNDVLTTTGARSPLGFGPTTPYVRMPTFNDSLEQALSLDPFFRLAEDPDVADSSTTTHARVPVTGNGAHLYFALTVLEADTAAIIDIDEGYSAANSSYDAYLRVLDEAGQQVAVADDSTLPDPGSTSLLDSNIQLSFALPGTYYIVLSDFVSDPIPDGAQFYLNVTMDHPITSSALYGDAGNDTLSGGAGSDMLHGGSGRDTVSFANEPAAVNASLATGLAISGSTDYLFGIENLSGSAHADALSGDSAWNQLRGEAGNDSLSGFGGADTLLGGAGSDQLSGGAGADSFVFDAPLSPLDNVDTILDFGTGADVIALDTSVFTAIGKGALPAGALYVRSSGNAAHDADDRIIYNSTTGNLYYDADGNLPGSAPVLFAIVGTSTHPALAASEFVGI